MTLALAMFSDSGLLIAADTRLSYGNGNGIISDISKMNGFDSDGGMYVITHSSEDANAANSLIGEIKLGLQNNNPRTFPVLETTVRSVLQTSYQPYHDNRPIIRLLLGACLEQERDRGLYLCEPPNTMSRVYEHYKAIGEGWQVADPIYKLFEDRAPWPNHACLCQVSYMMYRAKKLLPGSVGGQTDVAILTGARTIPYWIERIDMATAEAHGIVLDRYMSTFTSLVMGKNARSIEDILRTSEGIHSCGRLFSSLSFRCQFPEHEIMQY